MWNAIGTLGLETSYLSASSRKLTRRDEHPWLLPSLLQSVYLQYWQNPLKAKQIQQTANKFSSKTQKKNDKQTTLHCNRPTMLVKSFSKGWSRRDKDICTFAKPRHGRDLQQHAAHSRFSARLRRARCSYRMRFCGFTRLYGSRLQAACKLHAMRDAKRNGLFSASKRWFLKLYVLVIPSLRKHKPWGAACVYDSRQFCLIRTTSRIWTEYGKNVTEIILTVPRDFHPTKNYTTRMKVRCSCKIVKKIKATRRC